jgi:hypothetical protein
MDANEQREISERDQLWASLRQLRQEIDQLAAGQLTGTPRQQDLTVVLARIVAVELDYRDRNASDGTKLAE